jgi:hypothetical protein
MLIYNYPVRGDLSTSRREENNPKFFEGRDFHKLEIKNWLTCHSMTKENTLRKRLYVSSATIFWKIFHGPLRCHFPFLLFPGPIILKAMQSVSCLLGWKIMCISTVYSMRFGPMWFKISKCWFHLTFVWYSSTFVCIVIGEMHIWFWQTWSELLTNCWCGSTLCWPENPYMCMYSNICSCTTNSVQLDVVNFKKINVTLNWPESLVFISIQLFMKCTTISGNV